MGPRRWQRWRRSPGRTGLPVHMDGARFANAVAQLGCTPAELTWKAGVDVLSFGGTKNGCLGVEAVVLFDPARAWEFELRRKRGGHLFSKHRFLSAQMEAYLTDDLWLRAGAAAPTPAPRELSARDRGPARGRARCIRPRRTRSSPPGRGRGTAAPRRRARATISGRRSQSLEGPDDAPLSARLVCSWATTPAEVAQILDLIREDRPAPVH